MKKKISFTSFLLAISIWVVAQAPGHVPYGTPEPVEFTTLNIILLIILPILLFFVYYFFRKKNNKKGPKK